MQVTILLTTIFAAIALAAPAPLPAPQVDIHIVLPSEGEQCCKVSIIVAVVVLMMEY